MKRLYFLFIHQVPLAVSLLLCWVLGNRHLVGEAGDQTGRCCHRTLRCCHKVTTEAVEVWNRPPDAVRGGFLEEVVSVLKPEGPRRS